MSKRILAVLLIALISLFSFTACKNGGEKSGKSNSSQSASAEEENSSKSSSKSGAEKGENSDSGSEDSSGSKSKSEKSSDSAKNTETDGWKQQQPGTVVKGDVKVNVVIYKSAKLSDGQKLLDELIKGGMDEIEEVLSKQKSDNSIIYRVHGIRHNEKDPEYIKLQFVSEKNTGYVVTVLANSESDMDTDISYILENLKDLAQ